MMPVGGPARAWRWASRVGKAAEGTTKAFGPVVAALWVAWQYNQSQLDKRVEATLAYVSRYENADTSIGKAQRALTSSLWDHVDEINDLRSTRASAEDMAKAKLTIAKRVIDAAGATLKPASFVGPLEELDDFYNALGTCVQGHVCDEEAAVRFFGCAATGLVGSFGEVMDARDRLAPRFGWGVNLIAARARETKACPE